MSANFPCILLTGHDLNKLLNQLQSLSPSCDQLWKDRFAESRREENEIMRTGF